MIQNIVKSYEGTDLTDANSSIISVPIGDMQWLRSVLIERDDEPAGNAVFALKKNGVAIAGAEAITIAAGSRTGLLLGLNVLLKENDELVLDMVSGSAAAPIKLEMETDTFPENAYEAVKSILQSGANTTVTPNDAAKTLSVASSGGGAAIGARVRKITTEQSINNAEWTSISFNDEVRDDANFHDNSTNNSRLTIPSGQGGWYLIAAQLRFAVNSTGSRYVRIIRNGSTTADNILAVRSGLANTDAGISSRVGLSTLFYLAAGDYIEAQGYQSSGGGLNVEINDSHFEICKL